MNDCYVCTGRHRCSNSQEISVKQKQQPHKWSIIYKDAHVERRMKLKQETRLSILELLKVLMWHNGANFHNLHIHIHLPHKLGFFWAGCQKLVGPGTGVSHHWWLVIVSKKLTNVVSTAGHCNPGNTHRMFTHLRQWSKPVEFGVSFCRAKRPRHWLS